VSKSRKNASRGRWTRKRQALPTLVGPGTPESPSSLPPTADADTTQTSSVEDTVISRKTHDWYLPPDSVVRTTALKIIAMRAAGVTNAEIASTLGISEKSINPYIYRAGKNGWIDPDDPTEQLEYKMLHKVVRNLDEALDSGGILQNGMPVRTAVGLKIAEGTLFKKFDGVAQTNQPSTLVAVKIEMPDGPRPQVRAGNDIGGVPAHVVDAEVVDGLRR
jgi:hypothetical protein